MIYEGDKCPNCGGSEYAENSKGKVTIIDPEHSEIAQRLKITKKGSFAIRF